MWYFVVKFRIVSFVKEFWLVRLRGGGVFYVLLFLKMFILKLKIKWVRWGGKKGVIIVKLVFL